MLPDGWLTDEEANELRRLASDRIVLELGAWKGRSTVAFAETARYVVSVDRHRGITGHGESLQEYLGNILSLDNVAAVIASFSDFVPLLGYYFDVVYIDGDHDTVSVERDTALAISLDPKIIAMHDWDFDEVKAAGLTFFGEPTSLVGSVASFVR